MATGVIFFVVLSILVLVHELGHFMAARLFGIEVEEFAFGLPFTKPIFKIKKGKTQYGLYPLLFGGFVRLEGEEQESGRAGEYKEGSVWSRGKKQRMMVIAAGVVMNVVLALVGFGVLYASVGVPVRRVELVTVVEVQKDTPADSAGIARDDRIVAVEGRPVSASEFPQLMKSWAGVEVHLLIERGKGTYLFEGIAPGPVEQKIVAIVPRANPPEGQGSIGVLISNYPYLETIKCSMSNVQCLVLAAGKGVESTVIWAGRVFDGLRSIGKSLVAGKAPEGVSGPVGIYRLVDVVAVGGFWPLLELTAILSVNLAVFNVLPIPALDGGRMIFIWWEWVRKKRVTPELERKINSWGMAFLIGLLVLITLQDVISGGLGK